MGNVLATPGGAAAAFAAAAVVWLLLRRRRVAHRRKGVFGPRATEHLLRPGDGDYDKRMRELWGGPAPKHFQKCFDEWPAKYGVPKGATRTALVTGGTGGIGFYVVKLLARLGYEVIVPARTGFDAEVEGAVAAVTAAVPGARIIVPTAKLDLGSLASVRAFAADVRGRVPSIDALCLNAGRGGSKGDPREETADGVEAIVQVNAVAHFLLAAELWPLVRASPAARVVSQSSGARCMFKPNPPPTTCPTQKLADLGGTDAASFNAFHQYCLSKAANAFFTLGINDRLERAGVGNVIALVCDPGASSTGVNIQHNLGHSLLPLPDGWLSTEALHGLIGQHAADGALPMVLACVADGVKRNDWFTPEKGAWGAPKLGDVARHGDARTDPMNPESVWPADSREVFWRQAAAWTGAQFDFGAGGKL